MRDMPPYDPGRPLIANQFTCAPLDERLSKRVKRNKAGCLEWQGALDTSGYGLVKVQGRTWKVHRLVWTKTRGTIPNGLLVMHTCDNTKCANIEHLSLGTHQDNMNDREAKGRGRTPKSGAKHPRATLTQKQVEEIRSKVLEGGRGTRTKLARKFGVSKSTIGRAAASETYA